MSNRSFLTVLLGLFVLAACASLPLAAQEKKGPNTDPSATKAPEVPPDRVSEAAYIRELAQNGIATKDPYLVLQAAQMAITVSKRPSPGQMKETPAKEPSKEGKKLDLSPAGLLKQAVALAQARGDKNVVTMAEELARNATIGLGDTALADEIAKTPMPRGYTVGDSWNLTGCLDSRESVDWTGITFRGGELAEVKVTGSNSSGDIDIYIFDENGHEIVRDTRTINGGWVRWRPIWTGKFMIRLMNEGAYTCYSAYVP